MASDHFFQRGVFAVRVFISFAVGTALILPQKCKQ